MGTSSWRGGRVTDTFVIGEELLEESAPQAGAQQSGADVERLDPPRARSRYLARLLALARSRANPTLRRKAVGALALGVVAAAVATAWPAGPGPSQGRLRLEGAPEVQVADSVAPREPSSSPPAREQTKRDRGARSSRMTRRGSDRARTGLEPVPEGESRPQSPSYPEPGGPTASQTTTNAAPTQDPQGPQPPASAAVASEPPLVPPQMSRRETLAREFGL